MIARPVKVREWVKPPFGAWDVTQRRWLLVDAKGNTILSLRHDDDEKTILDEIVSALNATEPKSEVVKRVESELIAGQKALDESKATNSPIPNTMPKSEG